MKIKQSAGSHIFDVVNVLIILGLIVATLYPFYHIAIVSVSDGQAVMMGRVSLFPVGFNFESYRLIFEDPNIMPAYKNTLVYTSVGTSVNLVMTMLCAFCLSRKHFFGRGIFTGIIVFTMFFSGGMIPTYLVVKQLNLIDTMWALIFPSAISTYNMIIMRTFFNGLPDSLSESAYIDGANDLQILYKIIIPLSMPIIATISLYYAVGHWNSYFSSMLYINTKSKFPMQIILRNIVISGDMSSQNAALGSTSTDFMAVSTTFKYSVIMITTLPILLVYPFIQKYFVKGVMIGSLKG